MDFFTNPYVLVGLYGLACYFLTFITRRIVETAIPSWKLAKTKPGEPVLVQSKGSHWWNDVILYAIAPVYGVILSIFLSSTSYFPEGLREPPSPFIFGLAVGFLCGWCYKGLKRLFSKQTGITEEELNKADDPPTPIGG